ncbi:MAG: branched-chain amino acid ABC transporter permease [Chloroflexi bacterium]|nr:branched-chain amino acid ABC transporter permease [Chloroflexota bacterium]
MAEHPVRFTPPGASPFGVLQTLLREARAQPKRAWFGVFLAVALVYPMLDRQVLGPWLGEHFLGSLNSTLILVMLALGLNIVVGYAGLLDLGYAAFFAIGGYTAAFLTSPQSPLPFRTDFWVAMPLSFLVAALFGVILGAPTLRLRGDYLAIVTLAFGEIVPRVFLNLETITHGSKGMNPIGRPHGPIPQLIDGSLQFGQVELLASDQEAWYYLIALTMALSVFLIVRLRHSRLGRAWMAMREDEIAAASMGIDLLRTKLLAFAMGASFSGFAGSIFAAMLQLIDPFQFDFSISIIVLSMIILGGMGNVYGVLVGGLVFGLFDRVFADRVTGWLHNLGTALNTPIASDFLKWVDLSGSKFMIFGLALVLLMLLRPEGLFPSAERKAEFHEAEEPTEAEPAEGAAAELQQRPAGGAQ